MPRLLPNCFHTDQHSNPKDGWEWVRAFNYHTGHRPDIHSSKSRFAARIERLKRLGLKRSYVFGTGPSLERAIGRDWSDGYRIVSNTIVRDAALWHHLKPHIIVAGDAIYHFGHTAFARAFRRDLAARLAETDTLFVYPAVFDGLVQREFKHYSSRLVAVPLGVHQHLEVDLCREFSLPNLGNVLPLLLLPIGCTLSKSVCLWGFDGRAPTDGLFWANSGKHTYPELMSALREAHPKFFDSYTPKNDPGWYVKHYHGDLLDQRLTTAENGGYRFSLLHPSWTPTLQKRYENL